MGEAISSVFHRVRFGLHVGYCVFGDDAGECGVDPFSASVDFAGLFDCAHVRAHIRVTPAFRGRNPLR